MEEIGQVDRRAEADTRGARPGPAKSTLDQQTIEQLRSLGYLGGSPQ